MTAGPPPTEQSRKSESGGMAPDTSPLPATEQQQHPTLKRQGSRLSAGEHQAAESSGFMDADTFAEALSVVDDLTAAVNESGSVEGVQRAWVVDRVEEMLFDHLDTIEAEKDSNEPTNNSNSMTNSTDSLPSCSTQDHGSRDSYADPDSCAAQTSDGIYVSMAEPGNLPCATPGTTTCTTTKQSDPLQHDHDDVRLSAQERGVKAFERAKEALLEGLSHLKQECIMALLLLTPVTATLLSTENSSREAAQDAETAFVPWYLLVLRLFIVLVAARAAIFLCMAILFWPFTHFLPGVVLRLCTRSKDGRCNHGLSGGLAAIIFTNHFDSAAWGGFQEEERRRACYVWLLAEPPPAGCGR